MRGEGSAVAMGSGLHRSLLEGTRDPLWCRNPHPIPFGRFQQSWGSVMAQLAHGLSCKPSAVGVPGGEAKERREATPILKP